jgi:hypothetical protein
MSTPKVGDYGTVFEITLQDQDGAAADVSGATTKQIIFRKPGGTVVTKAADFVTDGTDGKIDYTAASGDLDTAGDWRIEGQVTGRRPIP